VEHVALGAYAHRNSITVRKSTCTQEFSGETGTAKPWCRK